MDLLTDIVTAHSENNIPLHIDNILQTGTKTLVVTKLQGQKIARNDKSSFKNHNPLLGEDHKEFPVINTDAFRSVVINQQVKDGDDREIQSKFEEAELLIVPEHLMIESMIRFPFKQILSHASGLTPSGDFETVDFKDREADSKTVQQLFKGPDTTSIRRDNFEDFYRSFYTRSDTLPNQFHLPLDELIITNKQERSTTEINLLEKREHVDESLRSFLKNYNTDEKQIFIPNYYTLGNQGPISSGNDKPPQLRSGKHFEVKTFYEQLWTNPVDEAHVPLRQETFRFLVENKNYLEQTKQLANSINSMIEPHMHLSSMLKLMTANLLRSKWGATIHKEDFFKDFMKLSDIFIEQYQNILSSLHHLEGKLPAELQALVQPFENQVLYREFYDAYAFLRDVQDDNPSSFEQLVPHFENSLLHANLDQDLENYEIKKDPSIDFENFRGVNLEKEHISMKGFKSKHLQKLRKRFFSQHVIPATDSYLQFFNTVGTQLTGFSAYAEYIRGQEGSWTLPKITSEKNVFKVRDGWYPFTNVEEGKENVRNDIEFDEEHKLAVIEGPNAAGKTNNLFQNSFIAQQSRTGGYVPAKEAETSYFDNVLFRLKPTGMDDDSGALLEELKSIQNIIQNLDKSVFIGIDETYLSTNYKEGEALTYGTLRRILEAKQAIGMITSHYPSLQDILEKENMKGIFFKHVAYEEEEGTIEFTYKLNEGFNTITNYALVVAEKEKLPPLVLHFAKEFLGLSTANKMANPQEVSPYYDNYEEEQVADSKTLKLLDMKRESRSKYMSRMFGTIELTHDKELDRDLENMISTPLTDYDEIIERLDTTQAFVEDTTLASRLKKIATVFQFDYASVLFEQLQNYQTAYSYKSQREFIDSYRKTIRTIKKSFESLPKSLRRKSFASKTLETVNNQYNYLLHEDPETQQLFRFITELDHKFSEIEKKKHIRLGAASRKYNKKYDGELSEEEKQAILIRDSAFSSKYQLVVGITGEEFLEVLDLDTMREKIPQNALFSMKDFYKTIYIYQKLADEVKREKLVRPIIHPKEKNIFIVEQGRYSRLRNSVPNSTRLGTGRLVEIIEGSNDAGKTSDLKKIGRIAVRAQSGGYVPAKRVEYSLRDTIIMREKGQGDLMSAFQTDCQRVREIMPSEDEYSLILMDESFTSTEFEGGRALVYGLARSIQEQGNSIMALSSHFRGLREKTYGKPRIIFSHFDTQIRETQEGVEMEFPYKKKPGALQESEYAIHVAKAKSLNEYHYEEKRYFDPVILEYAKERLQESSL